jgi:hypothetical protein
MEEHIAYFENMATEQAELFGPELRVARTVTERLRSGEFLADHVAREINAVDDHYDGSSWWGFVHCVAGYLTLSGGEWEVGVWFVSFDPWRTATVMIPKIARIDEEISPRHTLLDHLSLVLLPQFRDLAEAHGRFAEAYLTAKEIVEQLLHGDIPSVPLDDAGLRCRLGLLRSDEFLSCVRACITQTI